MTAQYEFASLPVAADPPGVYVSDGKEQERRMTEKIESLAYEDGLYAFSDTQKSKLIDYLTKELKIAKDEQFKTDCESDCWYCSNANVAPSVWDPQNQGYYHVEPKSHKQVWCDASVLFMCRDVAKLQESEKAQ